MHNHCKEGIQGIASTTKKTEAPRNSKKTATSNILKTSPMALKSRTKNSRTREERVSSTRFVNRYYVSSSQDQFLRQSGNSFSNIAIRRRRRYIQSQLENVNGRTFFNTANSVERKIEGNLASLNQENSFNYVMENIENLENIKRNESIEKKIVITGDNNSTRRDRSSSTNSIIEVRNYVPRLNGDEKLSKRNSDNYDNKEDFTQFRESDIFQEKEKLQRELLKNSKTFEKREEKISITDSKLEKQRRTRPLSPGAEVITAQTMLEKIKKIFEIDVKDAKKNSEAVKYLSAIIKKFKEADKDDNEGNIEILERKISLYEKRMQELARLNETYLGEEKKRVNLEEKFGDLEQENMRLRVEIANLREQ